MYHEKLVNFAVDSLKYPPLPSLMVSIERGMKRRIESSQETIPNANDGVGDHGSIPHQDYVDGLSVRDLPVLSSDSDMSSLIWKDNQWVNHTQHNFVGQMKIRSDIHSPSRGTLSSTDSNSQGALPQHSTPSLVHLPAQSVHRPRPFVPASLAQLPVGSTKPEPQSLPASMIPSDGHCNLSAWPSMLHSSKTAIGEGIRGGVDFLDPWRVYEERQQSYDDTESWTVDDDVLGFLKGK